MIEPFTTIGKEEVAAATELLLSKRPLSGFLGGLPRGGYHVQALESAWSSTFNTRHSIACNSGTSGLLAACVAVGVGRGTEVVVPSYTMSATAAAPKHLGATLRFSDIDGEYFCITDNPTRTTIATNLFGHPAELGALRYHANARGTYLIEDNAQGLLAVEDRKYAGTIGHLGVFSLNVHKHIHTGEGGIICTDEQELADRCRSFINHGELSGNAHVGLNLRMTEMEACLAMCQLKKAHKIVFERIDQAEFIIECLKDTSIMPPKVRPGCRHAFYTIAALAKTSAHAKSFAMNLQKAGISARHGYVTPLYKLKAFGDEKNEWCQTTQDVESRIVVIENCGFTITGFLSFKDAIRRAATELYV